MAGAVREAVWDGAFTAASFAAWAQSLPAGDEGAVYREPSFQGARAPAKAERLARELRDAREELTKAVLREGTGSSSPADGDVVLLHLTLRCEPGPGEAQGRLLLSTRASEGGRDVPLRSPLGEACTLLRGVELALSACRSGELCLLRLPPSFAFCHDSAVQRGHRPPRGVRARQPLLAEVELLEWGPGRVVRAPPQGPLVLKSLLLEGRGLETPHPPYELLVTAEARKPAVWAGEAASEKQVQAPFLAFRQLRLTLGAGTAPPGLEAALSSMRAGERASVWTAPEEGAFSALPELPRACPDGVEWTLCLEEVVQVRDMYGDGSLLKRRLAEGSGTFPVDCPIHDCVVRVHVAVFVGEGEQRRCLSDSRPGEALQFELGTGCQPPGLEACLRLMVPGERALVQADARHAYQAALSGRWSAPAGLPPGPHPRLEWELELVGFDAPLNWHAATAEEALEDAERSKAAGLALFADGAWELARLRFLAVASKLAGLRGLEDSSEQSCEQLRTACLLNAAACCQRLGEHAQAVQHCSTVLERMDGGNTKALYRRAVSRTELGLWEEARGDLEAARAADASVAADCERQLARLARAERDAGKEARAALGGFFK